jgi:hypothetical protein
LSIDNNKYSVFKTFLKNGSRSTMWNLSNNVRTLLKSHMHIFNVSITTVQGLKSVSRKVWEELITQSRVLSIQNKLEKWQSSITCKFFDKCANTLKKSYAHLKCVHNCTRFEECQHEGVGEVDYTK